jgi:asparagine synthase (glutamine-hydrolysing)
MCGIVGAVRLQTSAAWELTPEVAARMVGTLRHRGPDGEGEWADDHCWLGHTRLAIIDLAAGHQPLSNEDRSVWVNYNGEIYNHDGLRRELQSLGHRFASRCDTEILVHGYEQWGGPGLLQRLRGMFAFAVYDQRRRTLFLARDRLGIKPCYWWSDGKVLLFASEIKSLLAYPRLGRRQVDPNAVSQFLTFRYVPGPRTLFEEIHKLPAGHFVELQVDGDRRVEPRRYWDVSFAPVLPVPSFQAALERVDAMLRESVRLRLMSDVPLGAQLSGGVDSSLIVAYMEQLRREAGSRDRVQTFSVGFEEDGFSELPFARQVAERYGTAHHELVVRFQDFVDHFARLCWIYDEPVSEPPAIPTYLLCRYAKPRVTVMLTGEGGDELFAGYPKCAVDLYTRYLDWMPSRLRRDLLRGVAATLPFSGRRLRIALETLALADPAERYVSWFSAFDSSGVQELVTPAFRARLTDGNAAERLRRDLRRCRSSEALHRMLYCDLHTWLVDDLLVKGDRMSMASGVEARVPFLDHKLVEYAASLPAAYKARGTRTKILLKALAERYVPATAIHRRKVGFTVPLSPWFAGPLRALVEQTLLGERCLSRGYFRPDVIRRLVHDHVSGRVDRSRPIWTLLALEVWHRLFVDDAGSIEACERVGAELTGAISSAGADAAEARRSA